MKRAAFLLITICLLPAPTRAGEIPKEYRESVKKGLDWLIKQQHKDGHWSGTGGSYPTALTGIAGIALLGEGSTVEEGAHAENLRRAVHWLIERSNRGGTRDGLIGSPEEPAEAGRYMFGHAYAMSFLARVHGDVEDAKLRKTLTDVLTRAVQFSAAAQSSRGGWFYTSRAEGHDEDEGAITVVHLNALRDARNAGILVPRALIQKAMEYVKNSTTPKGGVVYTMPRKGSALAGSERPSLTAAALAAGFQRGNVADPFVKKWFAFCKEMIPIEPEARLGYDEFLHYYYAQAVRRLDDDGWAKMFPDTPAEERLTWSKYRKARFAFLKSIQRKDGSWEGVATVGPVYATAVHLTVLQLDRSDPPPGAK